MSKNFKDWDQVKIPTGTNVVNANDLRGVQNNVAPKPSKYFNLKTKIDGFEFDSKKEARRYLELKMMLNIGLITDLRTQKLYPIIINNILVCSYKCDFEYFQNGEFVVEDVKGFRTEKYRLKKRLMKAVLNIEIKET